MQVIFQVAHLVNTRVRMDPVLTCDVSVMESQTVGTNLTNMAVVCRMMLYYYSTALAFHGPSIVYSNDACAGGNPLLTFIKMGSQKVIYFINLITDD